LTSTARRLTTLAGLLVAALAFVTPTPAFAQQDPAAEAQARADRAGSTYIDVLVKTQRLDAEITELEASISRFEQRVTELRAATEGRAVEAYKRSGTPVDALFGDDAPAMDSARRTVLVDMLNARDDDAATQLQRAREGLQARQQTLRDTRQQHADLLTRLKNDEERLNAALNAARGQRGQAASGPPAPSVAYTARPGEHPQHNHPFLVCTRGIESGGNYQAYNGSGPYLGAYQFLQSTWNSTANHAGRGELVGVDPRDASEYDQDDMAWTLYQWKGKAPWGGRC
jgi:septal ring factor EnvC (AmiA/AmiB activator)